MKYPIYLETKYGLQIKIISDKAVISVHGLDINHYTHPSIFLENEDCKPSTDDAFERAFDSTILELKTLTQ